METSGINLKMGIREKQNGNKVGSRTQKWEQERNKVGTKWDQEPKSGNKRGTKWEQSGIKNPKVRIREKDAGTKWNQESKLKRRRFSSKAECKNHRQGGCESVKRQYGQRNTVPTVNLGLQLFGGKLVSPAAPHAC